jgi:hypothetical protein
VVSDVGFATAGLGTIEEQDTAPTTGSALGDVLTQISRPGLPSVLGQKAQDTTQSGTERPGFRLT